MNDLLVKQSVPNGLLHGKGMSQATVISESGLYKPALRSDNSEKGIRLMDTLDPAQHQLHVTPSRRGGKAPAISEGGALPDGHA